MKTNFGKRLGSRAVIVGSLLLAIACSSNGGSNPGGGQDGPVGDLTTECRAYCEKQAATGCPASDPVNRCQQLCEGIGMYKPNCEPQWNALNHCWAHAPLKCDANGVPQLADATCDSVIHAEFACRNGLTDAAP